MGVSGSPRISEEKGLFPPFSGFSRCSSGPPEKAEKARKRAKKADFGRFPGRAARRPLHPHCGRLSPQPFGARSGPISRDTAITIAAIPHIARYLLREVSTPPNGAIPPTPWYLVSHRHICAMPHVATYRAIIVRYRQEN